MENASVAPTGAVAVSNGNGVKKKNVEEASIKLIANLRAVRATCDAAIEEVKATLWKPREYEARFADYRGSNADGTTVVPREDGLIVPGASARFVFGADYTMPGTGFAGLPETQERRFDIERIFDIEKLAISDEDAPFFDIEMFTIGPRLAFGLNVKIPAARFAASAPIVSIDNYVDAGGSVQLVVRNVTIEPRAFRAKLVGLEQPAV